MAAALEEEKLSRAGGGADEEKKQLIYRFWTWSGIQCFSVMTFSDFVFERAEVSWDLIAGKTTWLRVMRSTTQRIWRKWGKRSQIRQEDMNWRGAGDIYTFFFFYIHEAQPGPLPTLMAAVEGDLESPRRVERENERQHAERKSCYFWIRGAPGASVLNQIATN